MQVKSLKVQLALFLSLVALSLIIVEQDVRFLFALLIALAASVIPETVIYYVKNRRAIVSESSIVTGLIVGFVISSDNPWWKIVFAAALSIALKHIVRLEHKHIFNPAALGIAGAILIFSATTQWKATYLWYVFAPAGVYFTFRINKLEVLAGYAAMALALFGVQAALQGVTLTAIFGYMSYFFIFVMLIEPKTSPLKRRGKVIFGMGVAVLLFILTQVGVRFDVELASLLAMNLAVPVLNKIS